MVIQSESGLRIGGVFLRLKVEEGIILEERDPRYLPFAEDGATPGDPEIAVDIQLGRSPDPSGLTRIFDTGESWSVYTRGAERFFLARRMNSPETLWCGRWLPESRNVTLHCGESLVNRRNGRTTVQNPLCYPLDVLLMMYVLSARRGVILHGAGVSLGGAGVIFPGKSGAGKSTIVRCLASGGDGQALSDDRIIVRETAGAFCMHGTPWLGTAGIGVNRSAPLRALYFLSQAKINGIRRLEEKEALERLLPVVSVPWFDAEAVPTVLALCGDLVARVPVYELQFFPGPEVGRLVREHVELSGPAGET